MKAQCQQQAQPIHLHLAPEFIHPIQFQPRKPDTPERALMRAVLEDAMYQYRLLIRTYAQILGKGSVKPKRELREVTEWFLNPDESWIFSFRQICLVLEINYLALIRHLERETGRAMCLEEEPQQPALFIAICD